MVRVQRMLLLIGLFTLFLGMYSGLSGSAPMKVGGSLPEVTAQSLSFDHGTGNCVAGKGSCFVVHD